MIVGSECTIQGRSFELVGYGWWPNVSNSGAVRPLARYAAPMSWMKVVGECEMFEKALGLSLPHTEVAGPITLIEGRSACNVS